MIRVAALPAVFALVATVPPLEDLRPLMEHLRQAAIMAGCPTDRVSVAVFTGRRDGQRHTTIEVTCRP